MSDETYEALTKPFTTFKKDGREYITGEQVTSRLNEVLGWNAWSFRVLEHGYNEDVDELWCLGELTVWAEAGHVTRQQFGSQKPNRFRDGGKVIDLGFDLKGAATDSLKKCASLLGVGLYLLEKDGGQSSNGAKQRAVQPGAALPATGITSPRSPVGAPAAAPPKPASFLELAEAMGFKADMVDTVSQQMFNNRAARDLKGEERKRLLIELEQRAKTMQHRHDPAYSAEGLLVCRSCGEKLPEFVEALTH